MYTIHVCLICDRKVYRGMSGVKLPECFRIAKEGGGKGGVDFDFRLDLDGQDCGDELPRWQGDAEYTFSNVRRTVALRVALVKMC